VISMWLGLDDTDYLDGGCTTLVFHELLNALPCKYGTPRLTRLWPFASRRTRGNASLSVELFTDEDTILPWLEEYWNEKIVPLAGKVSNSEHSNRKQYPSDPGMTLFTQQPDEDYYWKAVRGEVTFYQGGYQWGGIGRIGAAASCAWREHSTTWEGIAWREGERGVDKDVLAQVDGIEGTFLCRDPRTKRGLISPRGNCPIMFGVRATSFDVASHATNLLIDGSKPTIGSRVFVTNQASGDHIEGTEIDTVLDKEVMPGGHVLINKKYLAFSESGELNKICQWLLPGDRFECIGLSYENKIHLEGLQILDSTQKSRPICSCGTRMKSMGRSQGARCPACKAVNTEGWEFKKRKIPIQGWVQPAPDKRRHLAKLLL